jgi:hypothetical protein
VHEEGDENDAAELCQRAAGDDVARNALRKIEADEKEKTREQQYE